MKKILYTLLLSLININSFGALDKSHDLSTSIPVPTYKVLCMNGETTISQNLVNNSTVINTALRWVQEHSENKDYIKLESVDINTLQLLDRIVSNDLSVEDITIIKDNLIHLLRDMDFFAITPEIFGSLNKEYLNLLLDLIYQSFKELDLHGCIEYASLLPIALQIPIVKKYLSENYSEFLWKNEYLDYDLINTIINDEFDPIYSIAISPNGKYIVSGGSINEKIKVWSIKNLTILDLGKQGNHISALNISPDNKSIISACQSRTIRIWDIENGTMLEQLTDVDPDWVGAPAKSLNMIYAASRYQKYHVGLWSIKDNNRIKTFIGHTSEVTATAISSDNKTLISGDYDGEIIIWDIKNGKELTRLAKIDTYIKSIAISDLPIEGSKFPATQYLAALTYNGDITLWDKSTNVQIKRITTNKGDNVNSIAISSNGKYIVYAYSNSIGILKLKESIKLQFHPLDVLKHLSETI